jgi:tRNA A37 threonylcarbamoyltransferase TsaD
MKLHEHPLVQDMAGGAAIGHLACEGDEKRYQLITSRYSAKMKDCSFSFGGMLSQVQRVIEREDLYCGTYILHSPTTTKSLFSNYIQDQTVLMNKS